MGLFDSPSAAQWRAIGDAFGLKSFQPTASYSPGVSFRQLKRSLGVPADHLAPSFNHWSYGKWSGVEVMLLIYTVGSGSSETTYTGVIARVDPPLFLGISIEAKPIFELFAEPWLRTGNALVDERLRIKGFDPLHVHDFLALNTPEGMDLATRFIANISDLHITDSLVTFASSGHEMNIDKLRWQLDTVVYAASMLARRRMVFPWTKDELAHRGEWARFAAEIGFQFDPRRMTVFGQHEGSHIKIALETESQQLRTAVNVRFPQPVNVAFTVLRTQTPGFLQGLFGQDIKVGDKVFDDLYKVTGYPEDAVREVIAKPELIEALKALGSVTTEAQLNHAQLFFRVKHTTVMASELRSMCETARIASTSLFSQIKNIGPYR